MRGLAARIVAGNSQDSRRERREATRGATWKGREEQGGEGITRKEPPLRRGLEWSKWKVQSCKSAVEWSEGGGKREG